MTTRNTMSTVSVRCDSVRYKMAVVLSCLLIVSPSVFAANLREALYETISINPGTYLNAVKGKGSLSKCALHCKQESCDAVATTCCTYFCWAMTSHDCYLQTMSQPAQQLLSSTDGFRCFISEQLVRPIALGYRQFRGLWVKVYEELRKQPEARATCEADGGHLFYFKTLGIHDQVVNDVTADLAVGRYWVGAELTQDSSFRWPDGTVLPQNASVWMVDEPNSDDSNERCVEVATEQCAQGCPYAYHPARVFPSLNDCPCDFDIGSICQVDI